MRICLYIHQRKRELKANASYTDSIRKPLELAKQASVTRRTYGRYGRVFASEWTLVHWCIERERETHATLQRESMEIRVKTNKRKGWYGDSSGGGSDTEGCMLTQEHLLFAYTYRVIRSIFGLKLAPSFYICIYIKKNKKRKKNKKAGKNKKINAQSDRRKMFSVESAIAFPVYVLSVYLFFTSAFAF